MKINKKLIILLMLQFVSFAIFISCASSNFEETATFAGKICNQHGKPISGYEIEADGKETFTDSAGIFYLENVSGKKISVAGHKKGFTNINKKIEFVNRQNLFCFEVEEISNFYKKIDNLVTEKKYNEASKLLKTEKKSNGDDTVFMFYETLCDFYKTDSIEKKGKLKEKLGLLLEEYNLKIKEAKRK